ncbi:MAG: STAS domain-containing protein [Burkholderiaceae bacterium]
MSDPKDNTSFFRKVVKFVANPTTEWAELDAPPPKSREDEHAKSELKAMIERKRRNDFVRKREFDMLRKVRREGLTSEQLAALGGSSRLDDSGMRGVDSGAKAEHGVKAKIDEIEQQMVGESYAGSQRRSPEFYNAQTQPAAMEVSGRRSGHAFQTTHSGGDTVAGRIDTGHAPLAPVGDPAAPSTAIVRAPVAAAAPQAQRGDVVHDPELDEAVIAFANADFEQCEQSLTALTGPGGERSQHAETWLALFDLYRAIGQQHKFEGLALDYAQQFGWSAPQWFSMPRLVAEAASEETPSRVRIDGLIGWVCPEHVDADAVAKLYSQSLQMPLPWVFDWNSLKSIDAEACARLSELFRSWIPEVLDMRWIGGEKLFAVLQDAAPTGVRDADPAFWQLRLDGLRMANRVDQFDEAAIDYCVTYEVSPPSWEPSRCKVRISSGGATSQSPANSVVSDASTSFLESILTEDPSRQHVASFELSGQLVGDIGTTLRRLDAELGAATQIDISCARLIRVDFIAAGDLLNWVLARRSEDRGIGFVDAHRLVALFFGAMGINEHARVRIRTL